MPYLNDASLSGPAISEHDAAGTDAARLRADAIRGRPTFSECTVGPGKNSWVVLLASAARVVQRLTIERLRRRTYRELGALDERTLADIGLNRSTILTAAIECVTDEGHPRPRGVLAHTLKPPASAASAPMTLSPAAPARARPRKRSRTEPAPARAVPVPDVASRMSQ